MLTVQTNRHGTLITILNYGTYNSVPKSETQAVPRKEVHSSQQQVERSKPYMIILECLDFYDDLVDSARGIKKVPFEWFWQWVSRRPEPRESFYNTSAEASQAEENLRQAFRSEFVADWDSGRFKAWVQHERETIQAEIAKLRIPVVSLESLDQAEIAKLQIPVDSLQLLDSIKALKEDLEALKDY
jgi:hypothetical protein